MFSHINKSILTAITIAVVISLWLLSGVFSDPEPPTPVSQNIETEQNAPRVLVETKQAEDHAKIIRVFGQTMSDRDVVLKAETEGKVKEVFIAKGARVKTGDLIAKLSLDDRQSQLRRAETLVRQRQLEFKASESLSQKSFRSQTQLAEAQANLDDARAQLNEIRTDITHTEIRAPFDGILEDRMIEIGDFVSEGDDIAKIVDLNPIVIRAEISEKDVFLIKGGQLAEVILGNGQKRNAIVRFIANTSDNSTRTYRIEAETDNLDNGLHSGLTAQLRMKVGKNRAYLVSPSILTLSDNGEVGLKTVDQNDQVVFHNVNLLEDTSEGIWISGPPENARIITRGQEYVNPGQKVIPVEEDETNPPSQENSPAIVKAK